MSSKRAIRRNACEGKTRFETFLEAGRALRAFLRKASSSDGWPLSAYRCRFCNGFHFGHIPVKALAARRAARGSAQ
jgi:hypothetical protein